MYLVGILKHITTISGGHHYGAVTHDTLIEQFNEQNVKSKKLRNYYNVITITIAVGFYHYNYFSI